MFAKKLFRFMAATATPKITRPKNIGAIQSCARSAKGPRKYKESSSRARSCSKLRYRHLTDRIPGKRMSSQPLIDRIVAGDPNAVARAISKIEDGAPESGALMKAVFPHTGRALIIGITGAPGAGKSSLVDKLAALYRKREERVGIIAVDPSSPFSGGAILGDRIRMQTLSLDKGVFIRSMATRGQLGGLARATVDAVAILDDAGYEKILVETVGVGQDEIEIAKTADVCVVVLVPGMGDDVQTMKAGIMEIGDVLVINKAD